jgi:hypothetical protein
MPNIENLKKILRNSDNIWKHIINWINETNFKYNYYAIIFRFEKSNAQTKKMEFCRSEHQQYSQQML